MKIATKISLSFLVAAFILTTTMLSVVYVETRKSLQNAIFAHLATTVHSRAQHIETFLKTQRNRMIQLSQSIVLRNCLFTDKQSSPYSKSCNNAIKRLQRTEKVFKAVSEIFVLDTNGKIVLSSDKKNIGLDRSTEAYFLGGKSGYFLEDVYLSRITGKKSFAISAPITDDKTGRLLGVVVARMNLSLLEKITTDSMGLGKTGEFYIVNKYGYMITPSRFIKETFLKQKIDNENRKEALSDVKKLGDKPYLHHTFSYKNYRGITVWGVHDYITEMNWFLFAEIEEKEALEPLTLLQLLLLGMFIITPLLAWLLGMLAAGFITKPIHKLYKGTEIIGRGNLDYRVATQTNDEIGQLSRAFDKMTDDLKETSVSKDYVNKIIGGITDILIVFTPDGKITTTNKAVFDHLGYSDEELIGKDVSLLFPEEEEIPLKGTKLEKFIGEGALINYETQFCAKIGTKVPVLLSGAVLRETDCPEGAPNDNCPQYKEKGKHCEKIKDIVCVAKDITVLKNVEQELRISNAEIRTSLNISEALRMDLEKQKQKVEETQEELSKANKDLLSNEQALKNMLSDMKKTHKELEKAQAQLVQSEKLSSLGQLSAGIAHEINNPLGFVSNNISVLEEYIESYSEILRAMDVLKKTIADKDLDKAISVVEQINNLEEKVNLSFITSDIDKLIRQSKSGTERIKKIVQDLRIFARKDEGQMELNNIEEILEGVINIVWNEIKYRAELKKEYDGIPLVKCNSQKLGQVFINLLVNAAQAIKAKGEITISTYLKDKYACIEVSDTGSGIKKEDVDKIFDPFFTTKEVGEGTGLGLSIGYDIVKQHKGEMEVESEINRGTKFTVKLPM